MYGSTINDLHPIYIYFPPILLVIRVSATLAEKKNMKEGSADTENLETSHLDCQVINLSVSWKPALA